MHVSVGLFGRLRRHLPVGAQRVDLSLSPGATIDAVLRQLGIAERDVGITVLNGEVAEGDTELRDGDRLEIFAVMGGGKES